jgi:hypothetical protein
VSPVPGVIESIAIEGDHFVAQVEGRSFSASRVLLATGVVDKEPEMANLREAIDAGCIRLCAICDGHEVIDRKVAVYGPAETAIAHALFMRTFTRDLTFLVPRGDPPLNAAAREKLAAANIVHYEHPLCDWPTVRCMSSRRSIPRSAAACARSWRCSSVPGPTSTATSTSTRTSRPRCRASMPPAT